jgi:hypothetical protein
LLDQSFGIDEEASPLLSQRDLILGSIQKTHPELLFQVMDLARERWLRQAQLFCGAGEVQFFSHSHKVSKMTQFHIVARNVSASIGLANQALVKTAGKRLQDLCGQNKKRGGCAFAQPPCVSFKD